MKRNLARICIIALLIVTIFSAYKVTTILEGYHQDAEKFAELSAGDDYPFDDYPEMAGWIKVEGTDIDYPVMLSPDEPEKYLRANVDREYSISGTPFMDYRCTIRSPNVIIYGHNMRDGSMFAGLSGYEDRKFLDEHPVFTFTGRDHEVREYRVFAVMKLDIAEDGDLYTVIDGSGDGYENYVRKIKDRRMYDTDTEPAGEQIMCLSTCSYHTDDGRLMIAGLLKEKKEDGNDNS